MSQSLDSLPPPAVEWRRESDEERKQRLERAGIIESRSAAGSSSPEGRRNDGKVESAANQFKQQAESAREQGKKTYILWWESDAAHWKSIKSPSGTKTIADGSYALGLGLTHPEWMVGSARLVFGPKVFFYNGFQYAQLVDPFFSGHGFASFSASELGIELELLNRLGNDETEPRWHWAFAGAYTPIRWVSALRSSSAQTIFRSETNSRLALNLPGLSLQMGLGFDWNSVVRIEAFAGVHSAWPAQIRFRTGAQLSVGTAIDAPVLQTRE